MKQTFTWKSCGQPIPCHFAYNNMLPIFRRRNRLANRCLRVGSCCYCYPARLPACHRWHTREKVCFICHRSPLDTHNVIRRLWFCFDSIYHVYIMFAVGRQLKLQLHFIPMDDVRWMNIVTTIDTISCSSHHPPSHAPWQSENFHRCVSSIFELERYTLHAVDHVRMQKLCVSTLLLWPQKKNRYIFRWQAMAGHLVTARCST